MIFWLENNFNVTLGYCFVNLYNLDLKFKENWPKKGRYNKTSFFGTVIKTLLGTQTLFRKVLTHWSIKPTG